VRQRLTASFVVLSVVLLLLAVGIRGWSARADIRTHESRELASEAAQLALIVEQRQALDRPVDRAFLQGLVDPMYSIAFTPADAEGSAVVAVGPGYEAQDALSARSDIEGGGELVVRQSVEVVDDLVDDTSSTAYLLLLVILLAALVGYVMARLLSAPFRQLAVAAEQLGRGRFDLDLPRTRVPEARAISQALLTSAGQLQERLASEQAFAEHASHVLRTPLTGLRLELEDIAQRDDVPDDVRRSATRSVGRIEAMNQVTGDLVALSRQGALVAGAEIPLRDLATQSAQTWADSLAEQGRELTAAVEGSLDTTYTPGPVEHVLDLLRSDVLRRSTGAVRIVFEADADGHLTIRIAAAEPRPADGPSAGVALTQARAVVTALGGRLSGEDPQSLTVLLPRR
jgi:signal transduction histidine kinase